VKRATRDPSQASIDRVVAAMTEDEADAGTVAMRVGMSKEHTRKTLNRAATMGLVKKVTKKTRAMRGTFPREQHFWKSVAGVA